MAAEQDIAILSEAFHAALEDGDEQAATAFAEAINAIASGIETDQAADPTEGMSKLDLVRAGFGKAFSEAGAGAQQIGALAGNTLGLVENDTVDRLMREESERRTRDEALMRNPAALGGLLAGYIAQGAALPVGGLSAGAGRLGLTGTAGLLAKAPALESAIYGAAQGALMPTATGESRIDNALLNGLLGGGVHAAMQGAGKLMRAPGRMADDAMRGRSTSEYANAVRILEEAGVPLSTGQKTGTNWLKNAETTIADIPLGGKPLQALQEGQRRAYQQHLLKLAGLDDGSDMVTPAAMERLDKVLGQKYAKAFEGVEIDLATPEFINGLAAVEAKHSQFLPFEQRSKIRQIVDDLLNAAAKQENGAQLLSGKSYQRIRSHLGKLAKSTANSDGYVSGLYADLKALLDDTFEAVAGQEKFAIDKQFAAMKQLKAILDTNGGPAMSEGFISPVQVSRKAQQGPGSREWKDFTRAASAVLPDRLGNSGTAQRNMLIGLLTGGSLGAIDPMSLLYAPAMTRAFAEASARGVYPNVASMIPRFNPDPRLARPVLAGGRGAAVGLLGRPE
jgi:hypothetical protein